MNQPTFDSEFESFRRDRNYRRQQRARTHRPEGNNEVWEALEANEANEMQDRQINAEVDDFFSEATRMAAGIVRKVAETRQQDLTDKLRAEMEEFLAQSIYHATNLMNALPQDHENHGEAIVATNLKNLNAREIDEFRAEGTAQLADKHFGQDPFVSGKVKAVTASRRAETEPMDSAPQSTRSSLVAEDLDDPVDDSSEALRDQRMHLSDGELALDFGAASAEFEAGDFADELAGLGGLQSEQQPAIPTTVSGVQRAVQAGQDADVEDDLPLAALFENSSEVCDEAPEPELVELSVAPQPVQSEPVAAPSAAGSDAEAGASKQDRIREALRGLVRQGIMTKEQARAAYLAQTKAL